MPCKRAIATLSLACALVGAAVFPGAASALGALADVSVIDRDTGATLPVHQHLGRYWVEGRPGGRYALRVHNRSGQRLMAVMGVDGVNVISGETAGTGQAGYVFSPWERYDVTGWRKSNSQVAGFFFTALTNSYAARTGRPDDVGVVGVALFRERQATLPNIAPRPVPFGRRDSSGASGESRERTEAPARAEAPGAPAAESNAAAKSGVGNSAMAEDRAAAPVQAQPRLGTGHGAREMSRVETTTFQRLSDSPDEVITIHYDSRENLVAMGVIRAPRPTPHPRPFPGQPEIGFVPDPPPRR